MISTCRIVCCVVGRWCFLWLVCSLDKTLLAFALLHFVFQGQTCLLLQVSLNFLLLHSNPLWWKGHLFLVLVLEGVVCLYRTGQLQLLQPYWLGITVMLNFAMEMNGDHSVVFEIEPKYCVSVPKYWPKYCPSHTLSQQHKRRLYTWTSPDGQYWNQIDYILWSQRWTSSIQSAKTRAGADCG